MAGEPVETGRPPNPARNVVRDAGVILLMLAVLAGLGFAVAWPWQSFYRPNTGALARYAPSFDGWSTLTTREEANGRITLWQGANRRHLRNAEGYATELSQSARASIEKLYTKGESTADTDFVALTSDATFIQERVTELDASGVVSHTVNIRLRNADGEYIVSLEAQAREREIPLTPPGLFVPAELRPGKTWESAGQIGAQAQYTVTGAVAEADPYEGQLGRSSDCVQTRVRFQIAAGGEALSDRYWIDRFCAGIGQVEEVETDGSGAPGARWRVIAANIPGALPVTDRLPPGVTAAADANALRATEDWTITRLGRVAQGVNVGATIAPTYVSTAPPALLVATYEGDLLALDARSGGVDELWRFNPTGTIFGQPTFDPERGRIYFGASDKKLYALDSRGLFLWSFETGDNVATKPLLAGDLVLFGSEDRNAYAVEAGTGKLRWQRGLGSALVASPGLAAIRADGGARQVVIFGSDDGGVFGLDAVSGEQLWEYDAGKAVEAPIVVDGEQAFVASTGGAVVALDAASGEEGWAADLTATHTIRAAPAVTPERVYVVDELGYLTALSREGGRRSWISRETDYFGAPLPAGDEVLVAAAGAGIVRVGPDGVRRGAWAVSSASDAADTSPRLDFGPARGGGALWTIDAQSVVRRIGVPQSGPQPLPLAWNTPINTPPFAFDLIRATPIPQGDRLLVLDEGGRLYGLDPGSGVAEHLVNTESESVFVAPVLAGDLLIAASNGGLRASRLADGGTAWHVAGGAAFEPPVLAGDLVVWVSAAGGTRPGVRMAAVEVRTGTVRWERNFPDLTYAGGVALRGAVVYSASPIAAFDLGSGETLWEAADLTNGLGAPALSPDGGTLYAGRITMTGGEVVALSAATGEVRWQQTLPGDPLNLLERPWLAGDVLVVPTLGSSIIGLSTADGAYRWFAQLPSARFGGITVDSDRIYAGLLDGQMLILSAADGQELARRSDKEGGLESYARAQRPVLQADHVIMSFGSSLRGYAVPEGAR